MELLGHTVKYSVVYFTSSNVINAVCINNVHNITILVKFAILQICRDTENLENKGIITFYIVHSNFLVSLSRYQRINYDRQFMYYSYHVHTALCSDY